MPWQGWIRQLLETAGIGFHFAVCPMEICDFATYRVSFFEFLILSLHDGILEHFFLFIISIAILGDGSVVSWGDADFGVDIPAVRHQLKGVEQIQATERAFAAILEDGSVVA